TAEARASRAIPETFVYSPSQSPAALAAAAVATPAPPGSKGTQPLRMGASAPSPVYSSEYPSAIGPPSAAPVSSPAVPTSPARCLPPPPARRAPPDEGPPGPALAPPAGGALAPRRAARPLPPPAPTGQEGLGGRHPPCHSADPPRRHLGRALLPGLVRARPAA